MSDAYHDLALAIARSQEQSAGLMEKVLGAAQPGAVYSAPLSVGDYTIITASEVTAGGGFGSGLGAGAAPATGEAGTQPDRQGSGAGGGIGSGGGSMGRPVATIVIGPHGVEVKPVVDVTKIGLALFTALGAMAVARARMRRQSGG